MRPRAMHLALIAILLAGCYGPTSALDSYLRAAAGGDPDRGWQYIAGAFYNGDKEAYLREAATADWSRLRWSDATIYAETDGFYAVQVNLQSPVDSVPDFLITRHILAGVCRDGVASGLGAWYTGEREHGLVANRISGGHCDRRFLDAPSVVALPTLRPQLGESPEPCGAAVIEGELVRHDAWGVVIREHSTGQVREVLWPFGYTALMDGDRLVVANQLGKMVAQVGDIVVIGGGEISGDAWSACGSLRMRE